MHFHFRLVRIRSTRCVWTCSDFYVCPRHQWQSLVWGMEFELVRRCSYTPQTNQLYHTTHHTKPHNTTKHHNTTQHHTTPHSTNTPTHTSHQQQLPDCSSWLSTRGGNTFNQLSSQGKTCGDFFNCNNDNGWCSWWSFTAWHSARAWYTLLLILSRVLISSSISFYSIPFYPYFILCYSLFCFRY